MAFRHIFRNIYWSNRFHPIAIHYTFYFGVNTVTRILTISEGLFENEFPTNGDILQCQFLRKCEMKFCHNCNKRLFLNNRRGARSFFCHEFEQVQVLFSALRECPGKFSIILRCKFSWIVSITFSV